MCPGQSERNLVHLLRQRRVLQRDDIAAPQRLIADCPQELRVGGKGQENYRKGEVRIKRFIGSTLKQKSIKNISDSRRSSALVLPFAGRKSCPHRDRTLLARPGAMSHAVPQYLANETPNNRGATALREPSSRQNHRSDRRPLSRCKFAS